MPARNSSNSVKFIHGHGASVIVLDRRISGLTTDTVRCDSEGGAYQLTQLLVKLGHQQIAMLTGPRGVSTAEDRVAGYQRALADAGLTSPTALVYHDAFSQAGGYAMTQQALAASPRPTALFAANNFIALGALKALQARDMRVPEDMAMVAFDDLPPAQATVPLLTVAAQPAYEMGQVATQLLLNRLAGAQARAEIVLPTEIILRHSSGRHLPGIP